MRRFIIVGSPKAWPWFLLSALLIVLTAPFWGFEALVVWGLYLVGGPPAPPEPSETGVVISRGFESAELEARPIRFVWSFWDRKPAPLAFVAKRWAGRLLVEGKLRRHLAEGATLAWVSRYWTPEEQVEGFARLASFGRQATGLEQAACVYFGKPARSLTLAEVVLLVAMTDAPVRRDPFRHPEQARGARDARAKRLVSDGRLTEEEGSVILATPLPTELPARDCPD